MWDLERVVMGGNWVGSMGYRLLLFTPNPETCNHRRARYDRVSRIPVKSGLVRGRFGG